MSALNNTVTKDAFPGPSALLLPNLESTPTSERRLTRHKQRPALSTLVGGERLEGPPTTLSNAGRWAWTLYKGPLSL